MAVERRSQLLQESKPANPKRDILDASFSNHVDAFKSKSTWEVLRAIIVLTLCKNSWLVDHSMKVHAHRWGV